MEKAMSQRQDLDEFAAAYTAAWNSDDPARVAGLYAPDGVLTINGGEPAAGRDAIEATVLGFMQAFPDLVLVNDRLETVDNRVNYHWTFSGTNTGPGGTGNGVLFSGFESWVFDADGLILDSIGSYDDQDYQRQLNTPSG
jgi:uncharacterized protein (TIGR02246 family)